MACEMTEQCCNITIHTVRDANGVLHADTRELIHLLESTSMNTSIIAEICGHNLCVQAYATALYGIVVEKEQPTRDLILRLADVKDVNETVVVPITNIECTNDECGCSAITAGKFAAIAVGGTFDRLHAGHRLLLTIAAWMARETVYIGVTAESMLQRKQFRQLIQPFRMRADCAVRFVRLVNPVLSQVLSSELNDGAGIAGTLPKLDALVATSETSKGAMAVNEIRKGSALQPLQIVVVHLLFASSIKLSSTALREAEMK